MKGRALPQRMIDMMSAADRAALGVKSTPERAEHVEARGEAAIQRTVEAYCMQLGFERLVPENIKLAARRPDFPRAGWQYHLSQLGAKRNPMLPDITLFDRSGRFLWLELKAPGGAIRTHQQVMISTGFWQVAFNARDAMEMIRKWVGT